MKIKQRKMEIYKKSTRSREKRTVDLYVSKLFKKFKFNFFY